MLKEKIKPKPKFMSITQFTEYLGDNVISKQHVYKMIKKKEIPAIRLGTKYMIPTEWIDTLVSKTMELKHE